ncbi:MAG TPA: c-type cytochrome [Rhodanobacteraceae bacterium]|nr:c-type cytochrome [Rhodanobacteraceae bacterium]
MMGTYKRYAAWALAGALLLATFAAMAGHAPDTLEQRIKACTSCHGEQGQGGSNGFNPRLAGKPALYLYHQLLNFREGRRHYPMMRHMVEGLPKAYLREIADYFAAQNPSWPAIKPSLLPPALLEKGRDIVEHGDPSRGVPACAACHGKRLTGVEPAMPPLIGLPRDYIRNQLGAWRNGTRQAAAPDCMATVASRLTPQQITAVAGWLSSQPRPDDAGPAPARTAPLPLDCGGVGAGHEAPPVVSQAKPMTHGEYLARIGDCVSCHTTAGGKPLAGGRAIPTPFGAIYTPNITPDKATGIGNWSRDDFWRAMHEGVNVHGDDLYPAFPFPSFTRVTRKDVDAIFDWLTSTVEPVHRANQPNELSFPYSMRSLMSVWRALYFDEGVYKPDPDKSDEWNRGAYLVKGLGHCSACHTPRNWLGATRGDELLSGAPIPQQHWYAPDLGTAEGNGLADWSKRDIVDFLRTGRSSKGIAYGPMAEVVHESLQYLTESDAQAIAIYLLDRPSAATPRFHDKFLPPPVRRRRAAHLDHLVVQGHAIYVEHCAACHGKDGKGQLDVYPALAGNTSILAADPVNAIRKVLLGGFAPATKSWPRPYSMPPFIEKLSDHEVALVVTYIRHAWRNRPHTDVPYATVSDDTVAKYRSAFTH